MTRPYFNPIVFTVLLVQMMVFSTASSAKKPLGCTCPKTDSLSNATCGPMPARFKDRCAAVADSDDGGMKSIYEAVKPKAHGTKSPEELIKYFSCYAPNPSEHADAPTPQELQCHYQTTLQPLLQYSSDISSLPFAVEACQIRKESEFNKNATSKVGARGYVQFMPGTVADINEIIKDDPEDLDRQYFELRQSYVALKKDLPDDDSDLLKVKSHLIALNAKWQARMIWEEYWAGTPHVPKRLALSTHESRKYSKSSSKRKPHHGQRAKAASGACEKSKGCYVVDDCAPIAMAAYAVKQIYDLYQLAPVDPADIVGGKLPKIKKELSGEYNARDTAVMLAMGYNMGVGGLRRRCLDSPGGKNVHSFADCLKHMEVAETYKHGKGIMNCAAENNWHSIEGEEKPEQYEKRKQECEAACTL